METPGTLFIISAPSGGGKTSLVAALLKNLSNITVSVSHTTRLPRAGEVEGINYFFINQEVFAQYQTQEVFLESAQVFNNWYGTSKNWVLAQLKNGLDVILEIDWQGARKVISQMPGCTIFILPPSRQVLLERLQSRQQDSSQVIHNRMNKASQEISHYTEYDYMVINDDFDLAVADLVAIIKAQRLKRSAQAQRYSDLLTSLSSENQN